MKQMLSAALMVSSLALVGASGSSETSCHGIVEENNLRIPVSAFQAGGITEKQFNSVLDKIQAYYTSVIAAKGGTFVVNRLWTNETVNASAEQRGRNWIINMYGGLARHQVMTEDGMLLVACHEVGHHIGGSPKFQSYYGGLDWASIEGEADYYGNLRCMRHILSKEDNAQWAATHQVNTIARETCSATYTDANAAGLCMRSAEAGRVLAELFQALRQEKTAPRYDTPDTKFVNKTYEDHPGTQCRMDTYFQASLCIHDVNQELSDTDPRVGTCTDYNKVGARARCWFQPNDFAHVTTLAQSN